MLKSKIQVSIIIVNFNTYALTTACIKSVLDKTLNCSYEIILVDNGSSEVNPKLFLELFPDLILIESEANLGFAKGNNLGISKAKGEYVLLLNSDTILKNDAVSICLETIEANPLVAVVTGCLEYPDGTVQHNCQRFPSIRYKLLEFLRIQKLLPKSVSGRILLGFYFDYKTRVFPDWVWGTFFMFRKELLKELPNGKLADDFFMYVEDMQWCMDFRRLGYKSAFEPAAEVIHYMGKSKGPKPALIDRNIDIFMKKYYNGLERRIIANLDKLLSLRFKNG